MIHKTSMHPSLGPPLCLGRSEGGCPPWLCVSQSTAATALLGRRCFTDPLRGWDFSCFLPDVLSLLFPPPQLSGQAGPSPALPVRCLHAEPRPAFGHCQLTCCSPGQVPLSRCLPRHHGTWGVRDTGREGHGA
uniref:Uncharacterized protein n=1 Tax=Athene cunicularia TaxID=194338 RepID=A0A663M2K5_ATHCN